MCVCVQVKVCVCVCVHVNPYLGVDVLDGLEAHGVFAVSILCSLVAYGVFFIGTQGWGGWLKYRPAAVPLAFAGSGAATLSAGCYLALRVLFICSGCDGAAFVGQDLVQQQHLAISALLAACGALELAHGVTSLLT